MYAFEKGSTILDKFATFLRDYKVSLFGNKMISGLEDLGVTFLDGMGFPNAEADFEDVNSFRLFGNRDDYPNDYILVTILSADFQKEKIRVKLEVSWDDDDVVVRELDALVS